jgi:tRNA(fMet)-specific endonuclease VapC
VTGSDLALDTSVAVAVLRDAGDARTWISGFTHVYLPAPVLGELRLGALVSNRPAENTAQIEAFARTCQLLVVSDDTTIWYARIKLQLRQKGKPLPENDIWIAASCLEHGVPIATADAHFLEIDDLVVIPR